MTLKNFSEAVAVLTGGASGIGLATARLLYAAGAHVVLADINAQGLQQAELSLRESAPALSAQILPIVTDVTKESQQQHLMTQALTITGRIDLVVTCAGIGRGGSIDTFTGAEMQAIMDINFMGTYHSVRAALPAMRQQQQGHFVLLSSVAGKLCPPMLTGYAASKWAIRGFSSALRAELYGSAIDVTTVFPAWVETPMIHQDPQNEEIMQVEALLTADQVATAILQAVQANQRDLTLVPNSNIATMLPIMKDEPERAEQLAGKAFWQHVQQLRTGDAS